MRLSSKLKIGVVGVGHMGRYHANVLSGFNDIEFKGVFDLNSKQAGAVAHEYGIEVYSSLDALVSSVDAVVLATPTATHFTLAKHVLNEGAHILVEKPLTSDLREAEELSNLAQQKKLKLFVGHVERYNGAVQELERLVKNPYCWESRRVGPDSRRIKDSGVGLDLLIHDIDICLRTLGSQVVNCYASGTCYEGKEHEAAISAQLNFENGCLATFFATRLSHRKERSLTVTSQENTLILDFTNQDIHIHRLGQSEIITHPKEIRYQQQSSVERLFIHKANPLQLELKDFITSIRDNKNVDNSLDLKTLKVTLDIVHQAKAVYNPKN